jgi:hypothetical protein
LREGIGFAENAGAKIAQAGNHEQHAADQQDGNVAAENHDRIFPGNHAFDREHKKHGAHQQFVGDGVEILAEQGLLMQGAGQQSVEAVAHAGENEQRQRPFEIVLDQVDDDERQENHPQQRELVGRGEDLPEFTAIFLLRLFLQRYMEKLARQKRGGILAGFLGEALGERKEVSLGQIEFHALHAVHGKEHDARGEGLSVLDLRGQIVERRDIDAAQADAFAWKDRESRPRIFRAGSPTSRSRARPDERG